MASNTPDPKDIQRLAELYKKIQGYSEAAARNAAQFATNNGTAADELKRLEKEWSNLTKDVEGTRLAFANIVDEIKGMNSGVGKATTAFKGLESLAAKLQYHQSGISRLSSQELENLKKKAQQKLKDLELASKIEKSELAQLLLKKRRQGLSDAEAARLTQVQTSLQNINQQIFENINAYNDFNHQLDHNIDSQKGIEKSLGATGALMKGMSKIPFLGDLPGMSGVLGEVEKDIADIAENEGRIVGKSEAMQMAFKKMGPIIKEGLTDPLVIGGFLLSQLKDMFITIDNGAGELAKSMNMSYKESLGFREQLSSIAMLSGDAAINTKGLQETTMAINSALGSNAEINEEDLKTFTKLREQAGFTNEELVDIYKISKATGTSVKDTSKSFLGGATALASQKGLAINVKQLMKETAGVSNAIKLSVAGGAKGLAEAAVKAKEMGINLEQADKIAGSLLNFEDSISAELEAELLTGKQINLEAARLAALNGDIGTMAEEINKQIGGSAEFSKMNRIQQEAMAKAVGMSREELANSLVEQEALQRTGFKTAEAAKARYEELRKTMSAEEAAAALGDEQLAKQYEQQNVQERFTQAVEKLKDVFIGIVDGPLGAFMGIIADILSNSYVLYGVIGALAGLMAGRLLTGLMGVVKAMKAAKIQSLGSAILSVIKGAWETFGPIPIIGAGLAAAAAIAGVAYVKSQESAKPVEDGIISPDGGLVVSGKKGTYSLDPNDTVIAGTDLGKPTGRKENAGGGNPGGGTSPTQTIVIHTHVMLDKKQIAEAINQTNLETQVKTQ